MMNNKKFRLFSVLFMILVTATTLSALAENPVGTSIEFTYETFLENGAPIASSSVSVDYGKTASIDPGSGNPDVFATYVVNGKVEQDLPEANTFIVYEELNVDAYYKESGNVMVAFMGMNQDLLDMQFVASGGNGDDTGISIPTITGYEYTSWSESFTGVTVDTIVYPLYSEVATPDTYTVHLNDGTTTTNTDYDFNTLVTVVADGTTPGGNFQYWQMGDMIVSYNPTYTFTVLGDTMLEAIFGAPDSPDPNGLFLNMIMYSDIVTGYDTYVGQFTLPEGQDLVEYGVIASENFLNEVITLDTPDIQLIQSNKYNPDTNEFVRHLDTNPYSSYSIRGYMITTNGTTETVTYAEFSYAPILTPPIISELFISEYVEGGSYNKAIEIYNGTGSSVDLSIYSLDVYFNGSQTGTNFDLTGTIPDGEVFVFCDDGSSQSILDVCDQQSSSNLWSGDDAIALVKSGTIIDSIGEIGVSATTGPWAVDNADTKDNTLVRNSDILSPSYPWVTSEWTAYSQDIISNLGEHNLSGGTPINSPTSISITGDEDMTQGEQITLSTTLSPLDADSEVYWKSTNEDIAIVNQDGEVSAWGSGSVDIYVYSIFDSSIFDVHSINVDPAGSNFVVFDMLGLGEPPIPQEVEFGELAEEPVQPTEPGYIFGGWINSSDGKIWDFNDPVINTLVLEANWLTAVTVTYDSNDGSLVTPEIIAIDTPATEPVDPTQTGKVFNGWYEEATFDNLWNFTSTVPEDMTLYAQWNDIVVYTNTETFTNVPLSGTAYGDGSFVGDNSITWIYTESRGDFDLTGQAITLDKSGDGASLNASIPNGLSEFSIDYYDAFSGAAQVIIIINEGLPGEVTYTSPLVDYDLGNESSYSTYQVLGINIDGNFTISIYSDESQMVLDNFRWNNYSSGPDITPPVITAIPPVNYTVGQTVTPSCTAVDAIEGSVDCTIQTNNIDINQPGTYQVTFYATDSLGNDDTLIVNYIISATPVYSGYYQGIDGLTGTALESALTSILNTGLTNNSYADATDVLQDADEDPNNASKIILVYTQLSVTSTWDQGTTWNREHVWPQSLLGTESSTSSSDNPATDLHNLKPADPSENSSRSNDYFTNSNTATTYTPPVETRGDVARILFYMQVMYNDVSYDLELVNGAPSAYEMGDLATLLQWHIDDPVDDFEMNRNNIIYVAQGNRNPFIDHPELVSLIWN